MPVTVVSNAQNLGFPAAINQGLKVNNESALVGRQSSIDR